MQKLLIKSCVAAVQAVVSLCRQFAEGQPPIAYISEQLAALDFIVEQVSNDVDLQSIDVTVAPADPAPVPPEPVSIPAPAPAPVVAAPPTLPMTYDDSSEA
jgi:hypothetical protein